VRIYILVLRCPSDQMHGYPRGRPACQLGSCAKTERLLSSKVAESRFTTHRMQEVVDQRSLPVQEVLGVPTLDSPEIVAQRGLNWYRAIERLNLEQLTPRPLPPLMPSSVPPRRHPGFDAFSPLLPISLCRTILQYHTARADYAKLKRL
jgi:hypothetical protein